MLFFHLLQLAACTITSVIVILLPHIEAPVAVLRQLTHEFKQFAESHLDSSVTHVYDTVFHGLAIEFAHARNYDLVGEDANDVVDILQKVFYDQHKDVLNQYHIDVLVTPDTPVYANDEYDEQSE